jgi:heme-degrading monooxygenase HmoA
MFARVTRFQSSPDQLEGLISMYQQELAPALGSQPGNVGAALLVDRATAGGQAISYWDSAQSLQASEEAAAPLRERAAQAGSQIGEIDRFEIVIQERTAAPRANTFVRVNDFTGSPANIDEAITFARGRVLPALKAQKGFLASVVGVNRQTGRLIASSIWETAADREASEPVVQDLRREAGRLANSTDVRVELYETAFVEIKQTALV